MHSLLREDRLHLGNKNNNTLKPFYGVLKTMDGCIQFALLTGVTKFGKVSVFSDLNNLRDISMLPAYAEICGITKQELHTCFNEEIHELAALQQTTYEGVAEDLRKVYGGFLFFPKAKEVYNLSGLLKALSDRCLRGYWFEDSTPTYLMELLRNNDFNLDEVNGVQVADDFVNGINVSDDDIISSLYQSGYLVIKHYDADSSLYSLGFPNREVEESYSYIKRYIKRYRSIHSNG